jgi:hypothetical protein
VGLFLFLGRIQWILVAHSNLVQLHNNFILGLTLKQAQALLSTGTTMTHGHDLDMLDRASNT